jgi:unsaturated rhamnogalacturonyl hydrolase
MTKTFLILFAAIYLTACTKSHEPGVYWSEAFADAILERYNNINDLTNKGWEYSNSIVLIGIEKLYFETGKAEYLEYIKNYVDGYVDDSGNIQFDASSDNLDLFHPGWLCITLYEELGEEKYKLAAQILRKEFENQPRNEYGGFWHKGEYPNQMWADGIYMAEPFLMRYGKVFEDVEYSARTATEQAILLAEHVYDSAKNLLYHAWDPTREASWADPVSGVSGFVWSRGMGWYCMALVDILDYLPEDHENYGRMADLVRGLAAGLKKYQDPESGLWFQVVDKADSTDNWIEVSGSSMFVYFLKKAIDNKYIGSEEFLPVVLQAWDGLQKNITLDSAGLPVINNFVRSMGVKDSYRDYVTTERVSVPGSSHPHGYCGILLASSVMEFPVKQKFSSHQEDIKR